MNLRVTTFIRLLTIKVMHFKHFCFLYNEKPIIKTFFHKLEFKNKTVEEKQLTIIIKTLCLDFICEIQT